MEAGRAVLFLKKILLWIKTFLLLVLKKVSEFLGTFSYQSPKWWQENRISESKAYKKVHEKKEQFLTWKSSHIKLMRVLYALSAVTLISWSSWYYYMYHMPHPEWTTFTISEPLTMDYTSQNPKPNPVRVQFSNSAADLKLVEQTLGEGVKLDPAIKGRWYFENDRTLVFQPEKEWPTGKEFTVSFEQKIFGDSVKLGSFSGEFKTKSLSIDVESSEFNQHPTIPKEKKGIVSLRFNYPINPANFSERVSAKLIDEKGETEDVKFTVQYGENFVSAHIHSEFLQIPKRDSKLEFVIGKGVQSETGGEGTTEEVKVSVAVPGMYNFFRVSGINAEVIRNDKFELEHVLIVETTAGARSEDVAKNIKVSLLPKKLKDNEDGSSNGWSSAGEVTPEIRKSLKPVEIELVPSEFENSTIHTFKITADPGQWVLIKVSKGLKSFGDYILSQDAESVSEIQEFPKEVTVMHEGSILSLRGDKKIPVQSRNVGHVQFLARRLRPHDLQHLLTQSTGNFQSPEFINSWYFSEDNVAETYSEERLIEIADPKKTQYDSFDFTKYLNSSAAGGARGVFFFSVSEWDAKAKAPVGQPSKRFIVLTDLGVIAKSNVRGETQVFVQSFSSGQPVAGAKVDVLAVNGTSIFSETTDSKGRVVFPEMSNFNREKRPVAYVVKTSDDYSFLPIGPEDRYLNFQRFDVGGISMGNEADKLMAFIFTDRGIYRPGDEAKFGLITKNLSWSKLPAGLPLEFVVSNPQGTEVVREKFSLKGDGLQEFSYASSEGSPTGGYHAQVYLIRDGQRSSMLGSVNFKVEEFLPDRMKILATLSKENSKGWIKADQLKAKILLTNLFGTPAQNRDIVSRFKLVPAFPSTSAYPDYLFIDPKKTDQSYVEDLGKVQTDDNGEAEVDIDLSKFGASSYRLQFLADGFEAEGGRSVSTFVSVFLSPLDFVVGYKPDGDLEYLRENTARKVHFIALDNNMKKTAAKGLNLSIIEYKYVSVLTKQPNGAYKYQSVRKDVPVGKARKVNIDANGLSLDLDTSVGGSFSLTLSDKEGLVYAKVPYSVITPSGLARGMDRNAELQIVLNKTDYEKGGEIELQIRAPYTGAGLITIEREKVFSSHWFKTNSTTSIHKIPVPDDLEGNAYVSIVFLRSIDSNEIYTSPLSYGIAPFTISKESRRTTITLDAPQLVRPGDKLDIQYSASKDTSIVIYGVNEGILQVANYKLPDPLSFFFTKRAHQISTFQILDLLLPEFSIYKMLSATGGDMGDEGYNSNLNPFKRRRDKPVAFWSGVLEADKKVRTYSYDVPDYFNGSIRLMAVSASSEAVGSQATSTTVRGDFVLSANTPSFVTPGDEFEVSVGISNTAVGSKVAKGISLSLETSEHLEVISKKVRTLDIKEGSEKTESFKVRAKTKLGSATLNFVAEWNGKKAKSSSDLSLRPALPYMTDLKMGLFDSSTVKIPVDRKMFPEYRQQNFSASILPLILADGFMNFLNEYPFGCTEQIISKSFPNLVLTSIPDMKASAEGLKKTHSTVIKTLRMRQTPSGGFGYWDTNAANYDFVSLYAVHYLTEAKDRGMGEGNDLLERGLSHLSSEEIELSSTIHETRLWAYSLYLQARNSIVPKKSLETLRGILEAKYKDEWKSDLTGVYLSGVYALLKNPEEGLKIIKGFKSSKEGTFDSNYFYDKSIRESNYLYIAGLHYPQLISDFHSTDLLPMLSPLMKGGFTTINTSYAVLGLNAFVQASKMKGESLVKNLSVSEKFKDGENPLKLPDSLFPKVAFSDKAEMLEIKNSGSLKGFYQTTQAGFDLSLPKKTIQEGLEIQRDYLDSSNKAVVTIKKGQELLVRLRVRSISSKGRIDNVALIDLLPGGFEVVNESIRNSQDVPKSTFESNSVDIREDRVIVFGSLDSTMTEFFYKIKATNSGTFVIPPAFAEAMYDRSLKARGLSAKMTVAP